MEDAKTLFASLRVKARNAEFAQRQIEELKTEAAKCTPVMHLAPSGGGGEKRTLENNVIRIDETERRLQRIVDDYDATKTRAQNLICALDDVVQQSLLQQRYINGMNWQEISESMCYSETTLRRLHKAALSMADEILKSWQYMAVDGG